jgi:5S rRNA maturation endonuclease (ribonuclease M5)
MSDQFRSFLEYINKDVEFKGNRVTPCPVCGSVKQQPCTLLDNGNIYCHDPSCGMDGKQYDLKTFAKTFFHDEYIRYMTGKKKTLKWETTTVKTKKPPIVKNKDINRKIYKIATEHFHHQLIHTDKAYKHQTEDRGHEEDTLITFRVGYVDKVEKLIMTLNDEGYTRDQLINSGLFREDKGHLVCTLWNGAFVYPIYEGDEVITIKAKASPFTSDTYNGGYIKKEYTGAEGVFLNGEALKEDEIYIVEGENDLLTMYEKGYKNTVCILGGFGAAQFEALKEMDEKTFIMCFDNDAAGRKYEEKTIKQLGKNHTLKKAIYEGSDPDEALRAGKTFTLEDVEVQTGRKKKDDYPKEEMVFDDGVIRNYKRVKQGQWVTDEPYVDITDEMRSVLDLFYVFENNEKKRTLFDRKNDNPIYNHNQLWTACQMNGVLLDFKNYGITERKFFEWVTVNAKSYGRFSLLPEYHEGGRITDPKTMYRYNEDILKVNKKQTNLFRTLMSVFTVDRTDGLMNEYRLAAGVLSGFLGPYYDGQKPFFSVLAPSTSSGKTAIVRNLTHIVQGVETLEFAAESAYEKEIGGYQQMSNRYALMDNIEHLTGKEGKKLTTTITDRMIEYWEMNKSHGRTPNNKAWFGTFNNEYSFYADLQERILSIRLQNSRDVSDEQRKIAMDKSNTFLNNENIRIGLVREIISVLDNIEWHKRIEHKAHVKFLSWSDIMAKMLKPFYPEVEVFDFSHSVEDDELNADVSELKYLLDELFDKNTTLSVAGIGEVKWDTKKDIVTISNEGMWEMYKKHFGEKDFYAKTKQMTNKRINRFQKHFRDYRITQKNTFKIDKSSKRGWEIQRYKIFDDEE